MNFSSVVAPELNLLTLQHFPYGDNPNIIQQVAPHYYSVGTNLLNDKNGGIVSGIEQSTQRQPVDTMFRIFSQWLREDPGHSWEKLIHCLKQCSLKVLAEYLQNSMKMSTKG